VSLSKARSHAFHLMKSKEVKKEKKEWRKTFVKLKERAERRLKLEEKGQ
jgi:hypothetical protein